jgi:hypothetical protein
VTRLPTTKAEAMTAEEYRAAIKKAPKYRNQACEMGGEKYRSKREMARHLTLMQMQASGLISELRREVPFTLVPRQRRADGKAERAVSYVADYTYVEDGRVVVEDVKSKPTKTPEYVIKRKLMLMVHGITVVEVR